MVDPRIRILARRFLPQRIRSLHTRVRGLLGDLRLGIHSEGWRDLSDAHRKQMAFGDGKMYQPTGYDILETILEHLPLSGEDVFVDLGCGTGRTICFMATRTPLGRAIGIDIMDELLVDARRNAARLKTSAQLAFIHADACEVDLRDCTVLYLANPFGDATVAKALTNLGATLEPHPRQVRVVTYGCKLDQVLSGFPWLRYVGSWEREISMWASI